MSVMVVAEVEAAPRKKKNLGSRDLARSEVVLMFCSPWGSTDDSICLVSGKLKENETYAENVANLISIITIFSWAMCVGGDTVYWVELYKCCAGVCLKEIINIYVYADELCI